MNVVQEKCAAVKGTADLVDHGMIGSGSAIPFWLPPLGRRSLDTRCVATSPRTEHAARELGLRIEDFTSIERFNGAIGGADRVSANGRLDHSPFVRARPDRCDAGRSEAVDEIAADYLITVTAFVT